MVIAKKVKIRDREVEVRTLTLGDFIRLGGSGSKIGDFIMASLRPEDRQFLDDLDYDDQTATDLTKIRDAFVEVNPVLTKGSAENFTKSPTVVQPGGSSTGSQESSAGR